MSLRRTIRNLRRSMFEAVGNPKYSRPALNDLDRKLSKYLNFRNGFFVEAGANDGYTQSNTYYLERFLNWNGILVEGIPPLFEQAVRTRKKSKVIHCALVSPDQHGDSVEMVYGNLMSLVKGAQKDEESERNHIQQAIMFDAESGKISYKVQGRTLESVLDEQKVTSVDFLSLDVEGYEAAVLEGLNLDRYRPKFILIEARYREDVERIILSRYEMIEQLTPMDFLYKLKKS